MADDEVRKNILSNLYDVYREKGPNAGLSYDTLTERLGLNKTEVEFHVRYLCDRGYARKMTRFVVAIDKRGIDFIEGPSAFNPPAQFSQQKIEISGGSVGQINQAHIVNNPSLFLTQLADAIEKHPDIDPEKKKSWKEKLLEMANSPVVDAIFRIGFPSAGM